MRLKKRFLIPAALFGVALLGPRPDFVAVNGALSAAPAGVEELQQFVENREATVENLKPDNESRIVWADSVRKTPLSVVYLHGFSASPMEGDPIIFEVAERYGANLYAPRLPHHGIGGDSIFATLTPAELVDAAAEAIAIGQELGEEVILISCSTGATIGNFVAAQNPGAVRAQVMYSPNFALSSGAASLMNGPWGQQIIRTMESGEYHVWSDPDQPLNDQYWTTRYHNNGLIALQDLIEQTMTDETFAAIEHPVFVGYYYRDDEHKDEVVSIDAMKHYIKTVGTPDDQKVLRAFANANEHVIASKLKSDDLPAVRAATFDFLDKIVGLSAVSAR